MFGTAETLKTFLFLTDEEIEKVGSETLEGRVVHLNGEHRIPGMVALEVNKRMTESRKRIEDDTLAVWSITIKAYETLKTTGKYSDDRLELVKTY